MVVVVVLLLLKAVRVTSLFGDCGVLEQMSSTPCTLQESFGCRKNSATTQQLWVRGGCRGIFACDGKRVRCGMARMTARAQECSCKRTLLDVLPGGLCIYGGHALGSSSAFWHFIHGHLLPAFQRIHELRLYRPDLQIAFGREPLQGYQRYMGYYHALVDAPTRIVRRCANLPDSWQVIGFPRLELTIIRGGPNRTESRERQLEEYRHASNSSLARMCEALPMLHLIAAARRHARPRTRRPLQMVFLRRNLTRSSLDTDGASPGGQADRPTVARGIANADEVAGALRSLARAHGAVLREVAFEGWSPLAQVDLLLETDVLISYHGSGLGSAHIWMPPGSVVIEIVPHKWCYCVVATCAAHSGKAHLLLTSEKTLVAQVWKPGGWYAKIGGPVGFRNVQLPPALVAVLGRALAAPNSSSLREVIQLEASSRCAALKARDREDCSIACDGKSLQFWEPPEQGHPRSAAPVAALSPPGPAG